MSDRRAEIEVRLDGASPWYRDLSSDDVRWLLDQNAALERLNRDLLDTADDEGLDDRYDTTAGMVSAALAKGYTQAELGEKVGVSRRTVHAWLHKRSLPTDEHYARVRALVRTRDFNETLLVGRSPE